MWSIEELHEMRKSLCNCGPDNTKKGFVWPGFHGDTCPYRKEGEKYMEREERAAELAIAENSLS